MLIYPTWPYQKNKPKAQHRSRSKPTVDLSRMIRPAYIWIWRGQWICGPRLQRCNAVQQRTCMCGWSFAGRGIQKKKQTGIDFAFLSIKTNQCRIWFFIDKKTKPNKTLSFWERKMNHRSKEHPSQPRRPPIPVVSVVFWTHLTIDRSVTIQCLAKWNKPAASYLWAVDLSKTWQVDQS